MKRDGLLLLILAAVLGFSPSVFAATYYVSPSGSDANSGTSPGSPWAGLSYAGAMVASGDEIVIQAGRTAPLRDYIKITTPNITLRSDLNGTKSYLMGSFDVSNGASIPNLFTNGNMESWTTAETPFYWGLGSAGNTTRSETYAQGGVYGMQLHSAVGTKYISQTVYLPANSSITLTLWHNDVAASNNLTYTVKDLTGNTFLQNDGSWSSSGQNQPIPDSVGTWTQFTRTFTTGANSGRYTFQFQINGKTSYIDDISLGYASGTLREWSVYSGDTYQMSPIQSVNSVAKSSASEWAASGVDALVYVPKGTGKDTLSTGQWAWEANTLYYKLAPGETITSLHMEANRPFENLLSAPVYDLIKITTTGVTVTDLDLSVGGSVGIALSGGSATINRCRTRFIKPALSGGTGIVGDASSSLTVNDSEAYYNNIGISAYNNSQLTVNRSNASYNFSTGIVWGEGADGGAYSCIANYNGNGPGLGGVATNYGITVNNSAVTSMDVNVRNCTTLYNYGKGIYVSGSGTLDAGNNISRGTVGGATADFYASTISGVFNHYYNMGGGYYVGWGQTGTEQIADPLLDSSSTPLWDSPAIDAGIDNGQTSDKLGHPIYGTPDIGAVEYQPPYSMGTDRPDIAANVRIYGDGKFRNTKVPTGTTAALSIIPASNNTTQYLDIAISAWDLPGHRAWTETSTTLTGSITHTVGDLSPNTDYIVKVGSIAGQDISGAFCTGGTCTSSALGELSFTYSGTAAAHTFDISKLTDSAPPTVVLTAPASGATVSGNAVVVSAIAQDDVGVVGVQFKLDGNDLGAEDTTPSYSITWDATYAVVGTHTLSAVARDAAGNSTTAAAISVTVPDTRAPTPPSPLTVTAVSSSQIDLSWTAATDDVGVVGYKVFQGTTQIATITTGTTHSVTGLNENRSYNFSVSAYDAAGNVSVLSNHASARTWALNPIDDGAGDASAIFVDPSLVISGNGSRLNPFKDLPASPGTSAHIFIKRGTVIKAGSYTLPSGTAENSTIIGAYGEGADPVWDLPTGQNQALNLTGRQYITIKHIQFTGGTEHTGNSASHLISLDRAQSIEIDNCNFFDTVASNGIYVVSSDAGSAHDVSITNSSFVNFNSSAQGSAIFLSPASKIGFVYNITIDRNTFNAVRSAVWAFVYKSGNEMNYPPYGFVFTNNTVSNTGNSGVDIHGLANEAGYPNLITGNIFSAMGNASSPSMNGVQLSWCKNLIVEDNLVEGTTHSAGVGDGTGIIIDYKAVGFLSDGIIVRRNEVRNNIHGGIKFYRGKNSSVYQNYVHDNGTFGIAQSDDTDTKIPENTGNRAYNNTIVHNGRDGLNVSSLSPFIPLTNNISLNNAEYGLAYSFPGTVLPESSYNIFYGNGLGATYNYEKKEPLPIGTGSMTSNPLLTSDTNIAPLWNSPAIDAGTPMGFTTDYYGNPIYGLPDIGAVEYQPPYSMGTDKPDTAANVRIYGDGKFRNTLVPGGTVADLAIIPSSGDTLQYLDVVISTWSNTGTRHKTWTESSTIITGSVAHTVGDLEADSYYLVSVDGIPGLNLSGMNGTVCSGGICRSNALGRISFAYSGGYSSHTFDVEKNVVGGPVTKFIVTSPAAAIAGQAFNVTVTAKDDSDHTVADYSGTVHFSSSDSQAELLADALLVNGSGTFAITLRTAGTQSVTAADADTISGSASISIALLSVSGSVASGSGAIDCAPATVLYGGSFSCTVCPVDGYELFLLTDNLVDVTGACTADGNCFGYGVSGINANHQLQVTYRNYPVRVLTETGSTHHGDIQSGLSAVNNGQRVVVRAGTYGELLSFDHPGVTASLEGGYDTGFATIAGETLISGSLTITNGTLLIKALSIK